MSETGRCVKCGARVRLVRGLSVIEQRHGGPCGGSLIAITGRDVKPSRWLRGYARINAVAVRAKAPAAEERGAQLVLVLGTSRGGNER